MRRHGIDHAWRLSSRVPEECAVTRLRTKLRLQLPDCANAGTGGRAVTLPAGRLERRFAVSSELPKPIARRVQERAGGLCAARLSFVRCVRQLGSVGGLRPAAGLRRAQQVRQVLRTARIVRGWAVLRLGLPGGMSPMEAPEQVAGGWGSHLLGAPHHPIDGAPASFCMSCSIVSPRPRRLYRRNRQ